MSEEKKAEPEAQIPLPTLSSHPSDHLPHKSSHLE
jgi:serine/threonine protein kinase